VKKDADGDTGAVISGDSIDSIKGGDVTEQQRLLLQQDNAQEFNDCNDIQNEEDRKTVSTYDELLDRVVGLLQANNPDLAEKKRTRIKPPQLQSMSSKKTMW
jgi:hypothetical protein